MTKRSGTAQEFHWRPLLMSEYPPPGPTKYGEPRIGWNGQTVRPILVYVPKEKP